MSKFKLFQPWTWFRSDERKNPDMLSEAKVKEEIVEDIPIYRNIFFTGTSVVVILGNDEVVMKNGVGSSVVDKIKNCTNEKEIRLLLSDVLVIEQKIEIETKEERETVSDNLKILLTSNDFIVKNKKVFLKNIPLEIPAVIAGSFIELLERIENIQQGFDNGVYIGGALDVAFEDLNELVEQYEALKMFWYWTVLNPIESARNDLFNFIRTNEITITLNGLLAMYRRIVPIENTKTDKKLIEFISNSYTKVKKWKKSPKNFEIFDDNPLVLVESKSTKHGYNKHIGNLQDLYNNLGNLQSERTYTDSHTKTKDIKIGAIYREDEEKIDLDNKKECSNGLHVGSKSFGFGGFGDVGVLCLVNPMYVRSVPVSQTNKMRVSEMFIVGEMELDEYNESIDNQVISNYSNEYCSTTADVLRETIKNNPIPIECQGNKSPVEGVEVLNVLDSIQGRVKEII